MDVITPSLCNQQYPNLQLGVNYGVFYLSPLKYTTSYVNIMGLMSLGIFVRLSFYSKAV